MLHPILTRAALVAAISMALGGMVAGADRRATSCCRAGRRRAAAGRRIVAQPGDDGSDPARDSVAAVDSAGNDAAGRAEAAMSGAGASRDSSTKPFALRDGVLHVEDVTLPAIAARFGTPCYVYSRAAIAGAYRRSRAPSPGART